ncbi:MAG TPA: DUF58 domain-containing protein [Trueperaceae bacterium]|nr:DUF58 domain-containing protein [Trueperaceae bacterium]
MLRRLDGFLFGDVTGAFYGPSLDLAEVREYQPGDEVRRIDWFVTARTGTLHVRQYREEREIRGWLVVDRSPSMDFGTRRSLKAQVAREFAVTAASALTRQGNKIGSLAFAPDGTRVVRPGTGRMQVLRVLESLAAGAGAAAGSTVAGSRGRTTGNAPRGPGAGIAAGREPRAQIDPLTAALAHVNRTVRGRSLVFVVSDFLAAGDGEPDGDPAWARELRRLAARHDVIAVRVSDPAEHELPDVGDLRVRDPETGRELWLDTSDTRVRHAHARLVEARERTLARVLRSSGADVLQLSTAHDIVRPLLAFVRRRKGQRQEGARK